MNEENVENEKTEDASEKSYFGMNATELAGLAKEFMNNKDAIKEIVKIFSPVIGEVSDLAMDIIGPEAYKVLLRISLANVNIKKEVYEEYIKLGFNAEQAFYMIATEGSNGSQSAAKLFEAASKVVTK